MITEKLQKAINEQITAELWSSNLYLAMSFYIDREGFSGMASWLRKQSMEEKGHACAMADYMIKRGCKAMVDKIDVVPNDFGTPYEVFEQAFTHERRVSGMVSRLLEMAEADKDRATQEFLWGFVGEQVEEEASTMQIAERIKRVGVNGIFFIDSQLANRE